MYATRGCEYNRFTWRQWSNGILNHGARLTIHSPGTDCCPTNGKNNAVILSGRNPRFIAAENAVFSIEVTERKRGLVLTGEQPELTIQSGANVTINTMNASAILLNGFFPSATITGDRTYLRVKNETAADANAIEYVGDNSNFYLFDGGTLIVESQGAATAMSEEQNNATIYEGERIQQWLWGMLPYCRLKRHKGDVAYF